MSIASRPRPHASAWGELGGDGLVKDAGKLDAMLNAAKKIFVRGPEAALAHAQRAGRYRPPLNLATYPAAPPLPRSVPGVTRRPSWFPTAEPPIGSVTVLGKPVPGASRIGTPGMREPAGTYTPGYTRTTTRVDPNLITSRDPLGLRQGPLTGPRLEPGPGRFGAKVEAAAPKPTIEPPKVEPFKPGLRDTLRLPPAGPAWAAGAGAGTGLSYLLGQHVVGPILAAPYEAEANRIGAQVPAVAQANIEKAKTPLPQPSEWDKNWGNIQDWAGKNWGWLAGGGAALGGLALVAHQQAQRRKEEEEEELLQGLAKTGMAGLLAEFPVQVGFLARCGERGLSGGEVRAAVEKCAALSDEIAEDWIRFFAGATRSEAGTLSGLVKAAQEPGFAATGNPTPVPRYPDLSMKNILATAPKPAPAGPPRPAPTAAAPAPPPAAAVSPRIRGGLVVPTAEDTAAHYQNVARSRGYETGVYGGETPGSPVLHVGDLDPQGRRYLGQGFDSLNTKLRRPVFDQPLPKDLAARGAFEAAEPWRRVVPRNMTDAERRLQDIQAGAAGQQAAQRLGTPAASAPGAALPPLPGEVRRPGEVPAVAAPGQAYYTNEQRRQMDRPAPEVEAARQQRTSAIVGYSRQIDRALALGENDKADALKAEMNRLQARPAVAAGPGRGIAAANAPALDPAQELARKNVLEGRGQDFNDELIRQLRERHPVANYFNNMPTSAEVGRDQQVFADRVNAGVDPAEAAKSLASLPANDPTAWSATKGFARGMLSGRGPSGIITTPVGAAADVVDWFRGKQAPFSWRHAGQGAADLFSPFTNMGAANSQAARDNPQTPAADSFYFDVTRRAGENLEDYAVRGRGEGQPDYFPGSRTMAAMAAPLARNAGPILGSVALGGIPWAGGGLLGGGLLGVAAKGAGPALAATPWAARAVQMAQTAPRLGLSYYGGMPVFQSFGEYNRINTPVGPHGETQAELDRPWDEKVNPPPADPNEYVDYAKAHYQNAKLDENRQRVRNGLKPMDPAQEQQYAARMERTVYQPKLKALGEQQMATTLPGMKDDATGGFNPNGTLNPAADPTFDPKKLRSWIDAVPGRGQALQRLDAHATAQFDKLTADLPSEMRARLSVGNRPTEQDLAAMTQAGIDPRAIQTAVHQRVAAAAMTTLAGRGEDATRAVAELKTPEAMYAAMQKDPSMQAAAQKKVETGEAPDFMTGLKQTWDGLGTMGQILSVGGLALGAIGLMNAFSGEGGMGSILTTLLGGGGLLLGLNKDLRNSVMGLMGLGGGGAAAEAGPTPMTEEQLAAASKGLYAPGGNGEPTVAGPGAPGAAGQLGIDLKTLNMQDPQTQARLMQMPAEQQAALMQRALAAKQVSGDDLATAAYRWGGMGHGLVLSTMREKLNNPNLTEPQLKMIVDAFRRLPQSIQGQYRARGLFG